MVGREAARDHQSVEDCGVHLVHVGIDDDGIPPLPLVRLLAQSGHGRGGSFFLEPDLRIPELEVLVQRAGEEQDFLTLEAHRLNIERPQSRRKLKRQACSRRIMLRHLYIRAPWRFAPASASSRTWKSSIAKPMSAPKPRTTRRAWPISTRPTNGSSYSSRCCSTSVTHWARPPRKPQDARARIARTRTRGQTRSPLSRRSAASPNCAEGPSMTRRLPAGLVCISLAACAPKADLVITGGLVWTGLTSGAPQPGAVAVAHGKVLVVGDSAE